MEEKNLLTIEHMKKHFGQTQVLHDISLKVDKGEVVSVIGPSGSGKSTLLRCATLLENMDDGTLMYSGRYAARSEGGRSVYAAKDELKEIKRSFGLVFQNFNLFPHYSVMQNITDAPVNVAGMSKDKAVSKARELLNMFGLSDKEAAYPCELSGGQQQRVAIARALALEPKLLFFDEPTSALDPLLTGEVLNVIRRLAEQHMTMVIVTHEMEFAREVSDRILFIEKGYVVEEGTPEQLFASDNPRVRDFIGSIRK